MTVCKMQYANDGMRIKINRWRLDFRKKSLAFLRFCNFPCKAEIISYYTRRSQFVSASDAGSTPAISTIYNILTKISLFISTILKFSISCAFFSSWLFYYMFFYSWFTATLLNNLEEQIWHYDILCYKSYKSL